MPTSRQRLLLTALILTVAAGGLGGPSRTAAQPTTHQILVTSGDAIPTRGGQFGNSFSHVQIQDDGDVSFVATRTAPTVEQQGVFVTSALPDGSSSVMPVLQVDDAARVPMLMETITAIPSVVVRLPFPASVAFDANANGLFAIGADRSGFDGLSAFYRADLTGYELISDGRSLTVARAGGGSVMDDLDGSVTAVKINASGEILFLMGGFSDFRSGLFVMTAAGTVRNVAFPDHPTLTADVPDTGRVIHDIWITDTGTVFFTTGFGGATSPRALFRERSGSIERLLREGRVARPFDTTTIEMIRDVAVGPTGRYMVECALDAGGAMALYGGEDLGLLTLFAESLPSGGITTVRSGGTVDFTGLSDPYVSPAGNLFFEAGGTMDDGSRAEGIWRITGSDGTLAFYMRQGFMPTPTAGALGEFEIQDFNLNRDLVFGAAEGSPSRQTIWIRRGAEYTRLVSEGDMIDGLEVTDARATREFPRASINSAGDVALRLGVDTPGVPGEVLVYTVPGDEPPPMGMANLGLTEEDSSASFDADRITFRMGMYNDGPDTVSEYSILARATGMNLSDPQMVILDATPDPVPCSPSEMTEMNLTALCTATQEFMPSSAFRNFEVSFAYDGVGPYAVTFTVFSPIRDEMPDDDSRSDSIDVNGANLTVTADSTGIRVENLGPDDARNVRVIIDLLNRRAAVSGGSAGDPRLPDVVFEAPGEPPCQLEGSSGSSYTCSKSSLGVGEVMTVNLVGGECFRVDAVVESDDDPDETNNVAFWDPPRSDAEACTGEGGGGGCSASPGASRAQLAPLLGLFGLLVVWRRR